MARMKARCGARANPRLMTSERCLLRITTSSGTGLSGTGDMNRTRHRLTIRYVVSMIHHKSYMIVVKNWQRFAGLEKGYRGGDEQIRADHDHHHHGRSLGVGGMGTERPAVHGHAAHRSPQRNHR